MRTPEIRPGIRRFFRLAVQRDVPSDADDEIRLHLQLRVEQLVREGLSPEAARAEAERRFGSIDDERARFRNSARRRDRRLRLREWIDSVRQDVRYALRTLRRDAGFTAFAVLIVGLGIGASATVFSLVNGVLLRPMPFRDPARLVWISNIADDGVAEWRIQVANLLDLGARNRSLEGMAGYFAYYGTGDAMLLDAGGTQRLTRVPVTCNFLPFLGVTPLLGRSFTPEECRFNGPDAVLLTETLWRRRFASDPAIVGRTLTINDAPATVIGVLPASFDFPSVFRARHGGRSLRALSALRRDEPLGKYAGGGGTTETERPGRACPRGARRAGQAAHGRSFHGETRFARKCSHSTSASTAACDRRCSCSPARWPR